MTEPDYLTSGQVIERLAARGRRVTDQTVRRWAKSGKVPAVRLQPSGWFGFRPEDIDALIEPVEVTAGAA